MLGFAVGWPAGSSRTPSRLATGRSRGYTSTNMRFDFLKSRIGVIAFIVTLVVCIGVGLEIAFHAGRSGRAAGDSNGPFPRAPLSVDIDAMSAGDFLSLLAASPRSAATRRILEAIMADASLRARWERLVSANPGRSFAELLAGMRGEPGFAELLARLRKDPEFRKDAKDLAGPPAGMQPAFAREDGNRMMIPASGKAPDSPAQPAPGSASADEPGTPQRQPDALLYDPGLPAPLARMPIEQRSAIVHQMEDGKNLAAACDATGLTPQCIAVRRECDQDAPCAQWAQRHLGVAAAQQSRQASAPSGVQVAGGAAPTSTLETAPSGGGGSGTVAAPAHHGTGGSSGTPASAGSGTDTGLGSGGTLIAPPTTTTHPQRSCDDNPDLPRCRREACVAAGTPVLGPGGTRAIESLKPGDRVYSVDMTAGALVETSVAVLSDKGEQATLRFSLDDGSRLTATAEHPLYDPRSRSYRNAGAFKPGEALAVWHSGKVETVLIGGIETGPRSRVYDLSVEGALQNFLAGAIVAHNKPIIQTR